MQIKSLRIKSYRSWAVSDTSSTEAIDRLKKLALFEQLKAEGCSSVTSLKAIDWSRATYYCWRRRYRQQGMRGLEAGSRNAKHFLGYVRQKLPFELRSIQVDGGSEFRDEFEQACEAQHIPLFVLPPRKPKWNGCVERANGTTRYEFYLFYEGALTAANVNTQLAVYQEYYNGYRPHEGVGLETPMGYYQQLMQVA